MRGGRGAQGVEKKDKMNKLICCTSLNSREELDSSTTVFQRHVCSRFIYALLKNEKEDQKS